MIKTIKVLALLAALLLLASCSQTPSVSPTAAVSPSQLYTQPAETPSPSDTLTPTPVLSAIPTSTPAPSITPLALPTSNITSDLPDPASWQATLHLDPKDYPRVDGSTANIPLGVYIRAKITGISLADSAAVTKFTTTGPSYLALANKEADLLVVYEAPNEIKQQLKEQNAKLIKKPIGLDALVFLTNTNNPVANLTSRQLVKIYTGKITNWNQLGGKNMLIIPYQRISNSGSQALMIKLVMKGTPLMDVPAILQPAEMGGLMDAVASYSNTNNALGYSVYYYVRNMYKVPGIKLLSVNGVAPSAKTIASGQYPYINPFYAVIREDEPASSPAHKLFDWLTGTEGKKAVQDAGYVPPQS